MKKLLSLLSEQQTLTCRIIQQARAIQSQQIDLLHAYPSLYSLLIHRCKLTPQDAFQLARCVKVLNVFPELLTFIKKGCHNQQTVTNIAKYLRYFKNTNQLSKILSITSHRSQAQARIIIESHLQINSKYNIRNVNIEVDGQLSELIDKARNLLAHHNPQGISHQFLLTEGIKQIINKKGRKDGGKISSNGRYLSEGLRAIIWNRAQGRCEYRAPDGNRCNSTWSLEIDHIRPFSKGGSSNSDNLRLLCNAHNKYLAQIKLGKSHMDQYYGNKWKK